MREILFRGKRVDKDEMVFGDLVHGQGPKYGKIFILPRKHIYPKDCHDLDGYRIIPETVGQFTGLTDKNGVKIFEGDIVEDLGGNKGIIRYDSENASFDIEFNTEYSSMNDVNSFATVIGNMHDNPELI